MSRESFTAHPPGEQGFVERALAHIERVGNKVPHPAMLFLGLIVALILLSQVLDWANVSVTSDIARPVPTELEQRYDAGDDSQPSYDLPLAYEGQEYEIVRETVEVDGLLTADGIRELFTTFVSNFMGFAAVGVILVAMIGVGVAEYSGLIGALIRRLVAVSTPAALTYIIVFVGIISSVASDAGYLVLVPLAAVAFMSVGRHPLAGIAAAFGAVSAAFAVNILLTPADGVVTDITNEAARLVDPGVDLDLLANAYFGIGATLFLTVVIGLITTKVVEPRLGAWDRSEADPDELEREEGPPIDPEAESRGLRYAVIAIVAALGVVAALSLPSGAPLRNPDTGSLIENSPLMSSLIVIISATFLVGGIAFGRGAGTITGSNDVLAMITKAWASLAGMLLLFLLIASSSRTSTTRTSRPSRRCGSGTSSRTWTCPA